MTLTRTRACARSAETWTPVTVTNPTRGSRTLPVRKAATVWRMASATRAGRWLRRCFMSEETGRRVHDAGAVGGLHQAVGLLQHPLGVPAVVRHHAHRELGALPQVVVGRLRRRDVEAVVQPVFEALEHVALVLERLARREMQLPGHDGDHHGSTALGRAPDVERARHLFDAVGLDQVADLHVVEVLNADAALEALANLAHVVLEALERPDRPFVHLDAVADHPHPRRSGRSEEHTSELQSRLHLVCRLLLEKKKKIKCTVAPEISQYLSSSGSGSRASPS